MATPPVQLKEEGNALFAQKDYRGAIEKFTQAIAQDAANAIFYANRAQAYLSLKKYANAAADARKATELDPRYCKAWLRLGDAHDGLNAYPEAIEAYQQAITVLPTTGRTPVQSQLLKNSQAVLNQTIAKIMNPYTMSCEVLSAAARAHDIPISANMQVPDKVEALRKALFRHPKWGTEPRVRLLFIPQNEREPLREVSYETGPTCTENIARLLRCQLTDSVVLHSEDRVAYTNGKPHGVGLGRLHTSYEAFMDDMAVSQRPLNRRASELLRRPNTHGPIAVMKTTFIKSHDSMLGRSEDIICFEHVTEADLRGEEYKRKREEWVRLMGSGDAPTVVQIL